MKMWLRCLMCFVFKNIVKVISHRLWVQVLDKIDNTNLGGSQLLVSKE